MPTPQRSIAHRFFFTEEPAESLIVFVHVMKTAGTAMRGFLRRNLAPVQIEVVYNRDYRARTAAENIAWFREWYDALGEDRRSRLGCVTSHWAGYFLSVIDRDADALTIVREPVDRTLSYFFFKQRQHPDWPLDSLARLLGLRGSAEWRQQPPPEGKVLDQLFNNWQSRALLSAFHDVSTLERGDDLTAAEQDLWRQRVRDLVERDFFVGVQDRFPEYAGLLASRYGWRKRRVPHAKVNPQRPADAAVEPELRHAILDYNWLDRELYELARQAQLEAESAAAGLVRRSS